MYMRVIEIMTPDPACCTPDTRLPQIARLMVSIDCGEIPVVDDLETRNLLGVVTDRDIVCRAVAYDHIPADVRASEVMSSPVIAVSEDADVEECYEKMEQHQIRRIPVLDARGRISGIVAQADIALHAGIRETAEVLKDISRPSLHPNG
jgi:CBS domain-containing protein